MDNVRFISALDAALQEPARKYEPVMFGNGPWTTEEMAVVFAAFEKHVPRKVNASYNMWTAYVYNKEYRARPQSWDMGMFLKGSTALELAEAIDEYFGPPRE